MLVDANISSNYISLVSPSRIRCDSKTIFCFQKVAENQSSDTHCHLKCRKCQGTANFFFSRHIRSIQSNPMVKHWKTSWTDQSDIQTNEGSECATQTTNRKKRSRNIYIKWKKRSCKNMQAYLFHCAFSCSNQWDQVRNCLCQLRLLLS